VVNSGASIFVAGRLLGSDVGEVVSDTPLGWRRNLSCWKRDRGGCVFVCLEASAASVPVWRSPIYKRKLAAQLLAGAVYMYMRGIYVYAWIFIYNNRANKTKERCTITYKLYLIAGPVGMQQAGRCAPWA